MDIKNKFQRTIKKNKTNFIIIAILWVVLSIVFVMPIAIGIKDGINSNGIFDFNMFLESLFNNISNPLNNIGKVFSSNYFDMFGNVLSKFSIFYLIVSFIGIMKAAPKHEYDDIEHGSSDWCENGEQYEVLDSKKGILLAEKHYLPVDKRGNTNVLVIGRFWFTENLHHMLYLMHINV